MKKMSLILIAAGAFATAFAKETEPTPKNYEKELKSGITGWSVSVYGGANLNRPDDAKVSGFGLGSSNLSTKGSNLGGVAGIKVGYDFTSINRESLLEVTPALEFEGFYTGFQHKGSVDRLSGVGLEADLDLGVISLNPLLKFKYQSIQFYGGFGLGGAYISTNGAKGTGLASGLVQPQASNDTVLALQGIAGVDLWLAQNWSLFTEYKYLNLFDGKLGKESSTQLNTSFDSFGMHIVNAGIRYHF